MQLLIAESNEFSTAALQILQRCCVVELADLHRTELLRLVGNCEILWVRLRNMIDAEIMDAAPNLKIIATNTTGLNHIDLTAAKSRRIEVISLRGEFDFLKTIRATAEHTIGLTLALLRKIPAAHQDVCRGHWDRSKFQGSEIYEKTVGIVGYGRLGKIVAGYFSAFGADVIICDRSLPAGCWQDGFRVVEFSELLHSADIVSLHVNYEPANELMFGKNEFNLMKPSAYFINTSRGELVDESSLADALEAGTIAGGACDVMRHEQISEQISQRFVELAVRTNKLIITPHIAGNTCESLAKTEIFLANKLCEALNRTVV